jgi:hypothetical protein
MRRSQYQLLFATALATGVAFAVMPSPAGAFAGDNTAKITDPGFVPNSGQINQGFDEKVPTSSSHARPIPTLVEARAAKMTPDSDQLSVGEQEGAPLPSKSTMSQDTKDGQATAGGPQAVHANADAMQNGTQDSNGKQPPAATSDKAPQDNASQASNSQGIASQGPIGATAQTMPTKFSKRNDILDRVPTMSWLLPLGDAYRQQIYQAVMADKTSAASDDNGLAPATVLNANQALNETHPLPASVSGIPGLQSLGYVKTKNKVFLVEPATRIVVDEIGS